MLPKETYVGVTEKARYDDPTDPLTALTLNQIQNLTIEEAKIVQAINSGNMELADTLVKQHVSKVTQKESLDVLHSYDVVMKGEMTAQTAMAIFKDIETAQLKAQVGEEVELRVQAFEEKAVWKEYGTALYEQVSRERKPLVLPSLDLGLGAIGDILGSLETGLAGIGIFAVALVVLVVVLLVLGRGL